jgi:hypothetical protein
VKIFGIGLSRTGTHSLGSALTTLGFRSVHFPCDSATREEIYRHFAAGAASLRLSLLDLVDAVVDTPVTCVYKALDQRYPGSRFILTTRDMAPWLNSCERYWSQTLRPSLRPDSRNPYHQYIQFINRRVYDTASIRRGPVPACLSTTPRRCAATFPPSTVGSPHHRYPWR